MPINRPGETPPFYEYAVRYTIKMEDKDWPDGVKDFDPNPISIPPYQRQIVWKEANVKELLESKSILFGTVILATSSGPDKPLILLDGLQRFATATAILHYLYDKVLAPLPNDKKNSPKFKRLAAEVGSKYELIEYNHKSLKESVLSVGIKRSYEDLYESVKSVVDEELNQNPDSFAEKMIKTFVTKQIAIDTYYGFKDKAELIQTFININSTGISLTEVDLLRSEIIQQAGKSGWDTENIIDFENDYTEIFQSEKIKPAKVLGKHLYDALCKDPTIIFENWVNLNKDDVDILLNFIREIYNAASKEDKNGKLVNPYLYEIFKCGDVPFTITTWFFYKKMKKANMRPDSLNADFYSEDDLHMLLRAFYRRVVDGSINRIASIAFSVIRSNKFETAKDIAENLMTAQMGDFLNPEEGWMKNGLRKADKNRARSIFNACLLPNRDNNAPFQPLRYGTGELRWNIDHLIPKAKKSAGYKGSDEFNRITNFAPLRADLNNLIKNKPCSEKIKPGDIYSGIVGEHPYIQWLVDVHYSKHNKNDALEKQELLVINAQPSVGDDRIAKIAELLKNKI